MKFSTRNLFSRVFAIFVFSSVCFSAQVLCQDLGVEFVEGETLVAEIEVEGLDSDYENSPVGSRSPIRESIGVLNLKRGRNVQRVNAPLEAIRVGNGLRVLKRWLFGAGYVDAAVTAYGSKISVGKMRLIYAIERGAKSEVVEIRFTGQRVVSEFDLQTSIYSSANQDWRQYSPTYYSALYDSTVLRYLRNQGFINARVFTEKFQKLPRGNVVTVGVIEGKRYRIGKIELRGIQFFTQKEALQILQIRSGEIADASLVRKAVFKTLTEKYSEFGFLNCESLIEPTFRESVDSEKDSVLDLSISVFEGRRFVLGVIEFVGAEEEGAHRRLRRLIDLKSGQFFNRKKLIEGIEKINSLDEFERVELDRNASYRFYQDNSTIDVLITAKKKD